MWLYLCLGIILPLCAYVEGGQSGDPRALVISSSSGCIFRKYDKWYFYGAVIKVQRNVADIDTCISKCWKFLISGARRCQAVNYVKTDKRCEFMHQPFDITNRILVKYYGDPNPKAAYAVPIYCPAADQGTSKATTVASGGSTRAPDVSMIAPDFTSAPGASTPAPGASTLAPGATTASAPGGATTKAAVPGEATAQPTTPSPDASTKPTTPGGGETPKGCGTTAMDPIGSRRALYRIVGGSEAKLHSIPWIVSIRLGYTRKNHICGGTIVDVGSPTESDIVITAAHCVKDEFETDAIEIVGGGHSLKGTEGEQKVAYEEVFMHDDYNHQTKENDIAIVKLATPFKFGPAVQPACLPPAGEKLADGSLGLVAGWGRLEDKDGALPSDTLQQLVVPTVNSDKCRELYKDVEKPKFSDDKIMMCAGYVEGGKDSCQGDSGGPLFFKNAKKFIRAPRCGQLRKRMRREKQSGRVHSCVDLYRLDK